MRHLYTSAYITIRNPNVFPINGLQLKFALVDRVNTLVAPAPFMLDDHQLHTETEVAITDASTLSNVYYFKFRVPAHVVSRIVPVVDGVPNPFFARQFRGLPCNIGESVNPTFTWPTGTIDFSTFQYIGPQPLPFSSCDLCQPGKMGVGVTMTSSAQYALGYGVDIADYYDIDTFAQYTQSNQGVCVSCDMGEHQPLHGRGECPLCAYNTYSNAPGFVNCTRCILGQDQAEEGQTACNTCDLGKYRNSYDMNCSDCETGFYSNSPGSENCEPCAMGQYQDKTGQTKCLFCPKNSYSDSTGMPACQPCSTPNSVTDSTGATSSSQCHCANTFYGSYETQCTACPVGGDCSGFTEYPISLPGYWALPDDPSVIMACVPPEACLGGNSTSGICAIGYSGRMCALCEVCVYMYCTSCFRWDIISLAKSVLCVQSLLRLS